LLAASGEKQNVHLIELATGHEIAQFPGDAGALAFSPDGRTLLAGNHDSTIIVWDVTGSSVHGRERQALRAEAFDRLWADLRSSTAATAHRALWALAGGDARVVRQFKERLRLLWCVATVRWFWVFANAFWVMSTQPKMPFRPPSWLWCEVLIAWSTSAAGCTPWPIMLPCEQEVTRLDAAMRRGRQSP
jgi:WD40 repeat protein